MTPAVTYHKATMLAPPANAPEVSRHAREYADSLTRLYRLEKQRAEDLLSGALMQQRFLTPAEEIQRMLLPYGFETASFSQSPFAVSGDFLCFRAIDRSKALLVLGDTVENGLTAALLSMRISNLVQTRPFTAPGEFLEYIHRDITGLLTSGKFVAATSIKISQNLIKIANAGQPMPLLLRGGCTSEINASGIPLGLPLGAGKYRDISLYLTPGDRIVLYTDGVTAAENTAGEAITRRQFCSILERYPQISVRDLLSETVSELQNHIHGQTVRNDISIVIMEYKG